MARRILLALEPALGVSPRTLSLVGASTVAGLHAIRFEQRIEGLPLEGSSVELRLTDDGALLRTSAIGLCGKVPVARFELSREEAAELARAAAPAPRSETLASDPQRCYFPSASGEASPRPAWHVTTLQPTRPDGAWSIFIDAAGGDVLEVRPRAQADIVGTARGEGLLSGPQPANPSSSLLMGHMHILALDPSLISTITSNASADTQAVVSADGQKIAFVSDADGDREIMLMNADGSGLLQLTSNGVHDDAPSISADGSVVVFQTTDPVGGDREVARVFSDGSGFLLLTDDAAEEGAPSLSADGGQVVFASDADGDFDLYRVGADATGLTKLTDLPGDERDPDQSGDGGRVAFLAAADGDVEVFVVDLPGGVPLQLTFNSVRERDPAIAHDGSTVVFSARIPTIVLEGGDPAGPGGAGGGGSYTGTEARPLTDSWDLFRIAADGSGLERLTRGRGDEIEPDLDPSGNCIVYASDEDGDFEIFLLDLSGGGRVALTDNATDDRAPSASSGCGAVVWTSSDGDAEVSRAAFAGGPAIGVTVTDELGGFVMPFPDGHEALVLAGLDGLHARVTELFPGRNDLKADTYVPSTPWFGADLWFNLGSPNPFDTAQVTGYFHTDSIHDWLEAIYLRPPLSQGSPLPIDLPLSVFVNDPRPIANAFYMPMTAGGPYTYYFRGTGAARPNTAYDSVIDHEYGHFLDDALGGIGAGLDPRSVELRGSGLSEGIGDVLSLYKTLNPIVGEDFFGAGTWVRNYAVSTTADVPGSRDRQYLCEDCAKVLDGAGMVVPEPHDQGEAFAGFAWDVRQAIGGTAAEDRVLGALLLESTLMRDVVHDVFLLDDAPSFGGDGNPTNKSPNFDAICQAACKHGFDCPPQPDFGKLWCIMGFCFVNPARHLTPGCEWLGASVPPTLGTCDDPNVPDDGATVPMFFEGGNVLVVDVTVSIDPALLGSGRYGGSVAGAPIRTRYLYLNAWHLILGEEITVTKVVGTGSGNIAGPDGFDADTFAIDPENFPGGASELTLSFAFAVPPVADPTGSIVRLRLDYGEDVGLLPAPGNFMSDVTLLEACGPARYGEVEDYRMVILPPGSLAGG